MSIETIYEQSISDEMFSNYIHNLINQFFKILPIKESGEKSLHKYMLNLMAELLGSKELIVVLHDDSSFVSLIALLQYLIDTDCDVAEVKNKVFQAISICNKLEERYSIGGEARGHKSK